MSDFAGMEDLLQDFLQEATDLLSDVDNKLVDLEKVPDDRGLLGHRNDLGMRRDGPAADRREQVDLEFRGGGPLPLLHVRVADASQHVVAGG